MYEKLQAVYFYPMKNFKELKTFLKEKMKMTAIYQPTVIKFLSIGNGNASIRDIAKFLASKDEEIISYYIDRLKTYPKDVLKKHGIAQVSKDGEEFQFISPTNLTKLQRREIDQICDQKISEYLSRNTNLERNSSGWGKKRYELISNHRYCAMCGLTPEDGIKLDIDHIIPTSKGGTDSLENLQVTCHKCNRGKSNHLLKSASTAKLTHEEKIKNCIFCYPQEKLFENEYFILIWDNYPVTANHVLVIPKRHVPSADNLSEIEWAFLHQSFHQAKSLIAKIDQTVTGYNIGFNVGESAGQTVMHAHFHIIPRRKGDVENPRGGIRGVIPGKKDY